MSEQPRAPELSEETGAPKRREPDPPARLETGAPARPQPDAVTPLASAPATASCEIQPKGALVQSDPWQPLRIHTPARIALGRVGASLPTAEVLAFSMAHARARDAVHLPLDLDTLANSLDQAGFRTLQVRSQAVSRSEYLRRPDLGRRLSPESLTTLTSHERAPEHRLTVVVGDGLSSLAPARHAQAFLVELKARLGSDRHGPSAHWQLDAIVLASHARVALADEVGALRGAEAVAILLGERPGLSAADSLGIYMTWAPRVGRSDAERNCISNVRREGLSYAEAAYKLLYLLEQARTIGASGVSLKDASDWQPERPDLPRP